MICCNVVYINLSLDVLQCISNVPSYFLLRDIADLVCIVCIKLVLQYLLVRSPPSYHHHNGLDIVTPTANVFGVHWYNRVIKVL